MATSKKAKLTGALSTKTKKELPDTSKIEEITKKVYDKTPSQPKKEVEEQVQKTTLDLPKSLHLKAKIFAMEQGVSLKEYIASLIRADLRENGKIE